MTTADGQVLLGGHPAHPVDNQSVADVHPVVRADRHRTRAPGGAFAGVVEDLHPGAGYGPERDRSRRLAVTSRGLRHGVRHDQGGLTCPAWCRS